MTNEELKQIEKTTCETCMHFVKRDKREFPCIDCLGKDRWENNNDKRRKDKSVRRRIKNFS